VGYSPRVAKSRTRLSNFTFTFSLADGTALLSSRCPEMGFPQRPPGLVKAQKSCLALQVSPLAPRLYPQPELPKTLKERLSNSGDKASPKPTYTFTVVFIYSSSWEQLRFTTKILKTFFSYVFWRRGMGGP